LYQHGCPFFFLLFPLPKLCSIFLLFSGGIMLFVMCIQSWFTFFHIFLFLFSLPYHFVPWSRKLCHDTSTILCYVSIIIAFIPFNIVMYGSIRIVVSINRPMKTSIFFFLMVIIVILVRVVTPISHIIISSISFASYYFMTKIFARKEITKKKILIPGYEGSS